METEREQQHKIIALENTISKLRVEIAALKRKRVMTSTGHFVHGIEEEFFCPANFVIKD